MLTLNCESIEAGVIIARLGWLKAMLVNEDAKRFGDDNVEGFEIFLGSRRAEVSIIVMPFQSCATAQVENRHCRDDVCKMRQPNGQHGSWLETLCTQRSLFEGGSVHNRMEQQSIDIWELPN